jgi:GDPmannose 4,6-dehydratase
VREFLLLAAKRIGVDLEFRGSGENEKAIIKKIDNEEITQMKAVDDVVVAIDPRYFRPTEVDSLLGDATKAQIILGWTPGTYVEQLAAEIIDADFLAAKKRGRLMTHEW